MDWSEIAKKRGQKKDPAHQEGQFGGPGSSPFRHIPPSYLIFLIPVVFVLIWLVTGFYIVGPDEVGVVQRFGKLTYVKESGLHYHLPMPIEHVERPKTKEIKRLEIGFRTVDPGPPAKYRDVPIEASMLTGDENIVNVNFIVQYQIKDPLFYVFNIRDQEKTVRDAAESALREVIGKTRIEDILTTGKYQVQQETLQLLQATMDNYQSGLKVTTVELQDVHPPSEVMDAFKDVASAREDKNKLIDEAYGYRNDELPKARGEAARLVAEAEGSRDQIVKHAEGETSRFLQNYNEYKNAQDITRRRLYIETMEQILPGIEKYVLDKSGQGLIGVLPFGKGLSDAFKDPATAANTPRAK